MIGLVFGLGFAISCVSGLLGIGGGILMAPALLYFPPLLGLGSLEMRDVTGLTITQGLFACLSAALRHDSYGCVDRRLVAWMGGTIAISSLGGSLASGSVANRTLMLIFAALSLLAALLMLIPKDDREGGDDGSRRTSPQFSVPLAVVIASGIGVLGGLVGQGGSFILIPLMLHALHLPTRTVIGSNLAIVFFSSLAGCIGKLAGGQVPLVLAGVLAIASVAGAQVGSALGLRTPPRSLRLGLAAVVATAAAIVSVDAFSASE